MPYISAQKNLWKLSGDLVMDNANAVLKESLALEMHDMLTVDFFAVTDVDTATLALLLAWIKRAKENLCQVSFVHVPKNLTSLVLLYNVQDFIVLH